MSTTEWLRTEMRVAMAHPKYRCRKNASEESVNGTKKHSKSYKQRKLCCFFEYNTGFNTFDDTVGTRFMFVLSCSFRNDAFSFSFNQLCRVISPIIQKALHVPVFLFSFGPRVQHPTRARTFRCFFLGRRNQLYQFYAYFGI